MPSGPMSTGIVEKLAALIGRRPGSSGTTRSEATGREFDAIMQRLDTGIAAYRKDMASLMESLNRRAA